MWRASVHTIRSAELNNATELVNEFGSLWFRFIQSIQAVLLLEYGESKSMFASILVHTRCLYVCFVGHVLFRDDAVNMLLGV